MGRNTSIEASQGDVRPRLWRKKPVVIEAVQWTGYNVAEMADFGVAEGAVTASRTLQIDTLEGVMSASPGDWIIRGVAGEYYPCRPDIFAATYEPAEARHE